MRALCGALVVLSCVGMAWADQIDRSPVPRANPLIQTGAVAAEAAPAAVPASAEATPDAVLLASLRPMPRPKAISEMVAAAKAGAGGKGLDLAAMMPEDEAPEPEPKKMTRAEKKAAREKERESSSRKGSVCGVAAIKGEKIAPIKAKVKGCGLADGVRVTSVSGVRLSQSATIDCDTARALNTWVSKVLQPAYGGDVVELRVAGHYVCRPRNNRSGAKISEHGRGKAIDISAFKLSNGKVLSVLGGFNKTMRKAHKGACGIFGTTLGPGSDGYHEDHLHFDTANHRNGSYCR